MDTKYIDALLGTLSAQRNAALDEAARLNASLGVMQAERDAARKAAEGPAPAGLDAGLVTTALGEAREQMASALAAVGFEPSDSDPLGGPMHILESLASKIGLKL